MTAFRDLAPEEQQRLEDAAGWRLRLERDSSLQRSREYLQWSSDSRNANASAAVGRGWLSIDTLESSSELSELRRQALMRLRDAGAQRRKRGTQYRIAVTAVVLAAIGVTTLYLKLQLPTAYETDIGERRVVALPDGSRVSMDSDTKIQVTYRKAARSISLERGRSRFDVAHDSSRPFAVTAGRQTVVAVGTSFDVERLQSRVLITLIQGQVVIKGAEAQTTTAENGHDDAVSLKAGEQLVAAQNVRPAIVTTDLQVARAWEAGRLLFRDEPLGDAVARVNRYTAHPIAIDPSIESIRISGVFNAGDIGSFVSAVTSYFPVQASTTKTNSILLQPRS
jgi:transmembrane sensor